MKGIFQTLKQRWTNHFHSISSYIFN